MLRNRTAVTGVLLMLLATSPASAQGPGRGWELLGEMRVNGSIDHDQIPVTDARGGFRAIQLRVLNGPVRFLRVVVHYGNGADQELSMRALIPAGGTTRAIDLPGDRRIIRSVELWYSKANWGTRLPIVRLYGRS